MRRAWSRAAIAASLIAGCAWALVQPSLLRAQAPPPPPGVDAALDSVRAVRGISIRISLLTYGPGNAVFERFGHMALAVRDTATGEDIAFNWGMFDFSQPNFLPRFLTGDTSYWMAGFSTEAFNALYRSENRRIRRQLLILPPVERAALFEFVAWNAREENKFYRYDYYRDNCATRVRDAIDRVLRGRLRVALNAPGAGRTWRGETARITATDMPTYAGIQVALGRHADEFLSKWDESFLPDHLADHLASFVVQEQDGSRYRLVREDSVLFEADRVPLPTEPPGRLAMAALLGLTVAGIIAALADADRRSVRVILAGVIGVWYVVGGLLGTALLLAATVTKHAPYMGSNTTLLQLHPLMLIAAWPVSVSLARQTRSRAALGVSLVLAALAVCGAVLQLVPAFVQSSGVVLAVTVPVHLALALAMWRLDHDPHSSPQLSTRVSRAA